MSNREESEGRCVARPVVSGDQIQKCGRADKRDRINKAKLAMSVSRNLNSIIIVRWSVPETDNFVQHVNKMERACRQSL